MKAIKRKSKMVEIRPPLLIQMAEQARVAAEFCKLAALEEKRYGKANALTEQKAKAACHRLRRLINDL